MSNCSRWSFELMALRSKPGEIMKRDKYSSYATRFKTFSVIKKDFKKEQCIFKKLQSILKEPIFSLLCSWKPVQKLFVLHLQWKIPPFI